TVADGSKVQGSALSLVSGSGVNILDHLDVASLTVSGPATINVAGSIPLNPSVRSSGNQTYNASLTLGNDTVLEGATPSFASAVNGNNHDLTLNFSGVTLVDGANFSGIKNLSTGNGGVTQLRNAILTSGSQTYNDD